MAHIVDLRSDTVTKPTKAMKHAMVNSALGDDVFCEDPTINSLESKIATILGKQAALFVPSGTMANLIAIMVHCNKRGSEAFVGNHSHIYKYEQGGAAHIAGVLLSTLDNKPDGTFDLKDLEKRIRGSNIHEPITSLVAVENTHNYCGGKVLPLKFLDDLADLCKKHALPIHMDGARLFNACEYLNEKPSRVVRDCDSVSVCFSKGLSAPVGSALVGSYHFIKQCSSCAYVRSVLEYASTTWSPQYSSHVDRIESIQRRFVRNLQYRSGVFFDHYHDRCKHFGLLTLKDRRTVADMSLLHEVVNGHIACPYLVSQFGLNAPIKRTRNTSLFHIPFHRTNYAMNSPISRILKTHNTCFPDMDPFVFSKSLYKNKIISSLNSE